MNGYRAIGAHVFAGSFTRGVMDVMDVAAQLEIHGLGVETTRRKLGVSVVEAKRWEDWPRLQCDMLYGNPRCSGFSCVTTQLGPRGHGPNALATKDIWDFIQYGVAIQPAIMMFESVRQAYTVGMPLLRRLIDEYLLLADYRICHIILTASTFGCAQNRVRYFFIAYKRGLQFNLSLPPLMRKRVTLRDVIGDLEDVETTPIRANAEEYSDDGYYEPNEEQKACIPLLERGWNLNDLARYRTESMPKKMQQWWHLRSSNIPFSLHCLRRLAYDVPAPTLFGGVMHHMVHPVKDRTLTVREVARIMGQDYTPIGRNPGAQMVKAVCPAVGKWIAEQAAHCLNGTWDDQDMVARFDHRNGKWIDGDRNGADEKTFHIHNYCPQI